MRRLIILTDESSEFLVSKADLRNFTSMDVGLIREWFARNNYSVSVFKFSEFDLSEEYRDCYILYQTSEAPGGFYKRYIEDLIYTLEERGAVVLPSFKYLKAHHDKVFMELLRLGFSDEALKTIRSRAFGSWVDALSYRGNYPVVIKQASGSAGEKVFLAHNEQQYRRLVRKAGKTIVASGCTDLAVTTLKRMAKKSVKLISPEKRGYVRYNTDPVSSPVVVQNFIPGMDGDFRVIYFAGRYYCMHRGIRKNDFRASGSGQFSDVREEYLEGLLSFARRLTLEIDFPVIGMDIGYDGTSFHLIEFQMLNFGTSALQRSDSWHEYDGNRWIRKQGHSVLEEELARSVDWFITGKTG